MHLFGYGKIEIMHILGYSKTRFMHIFGGSAQMYLSVAERKFASFAEYSLHSLSKANFDCSANL